MGAQPGTLGPPLVGTPGHKQNRRPRNHNRPGHGSRAQRPLRAHTGTLRCLPWARASGPGLQDPTTLKSQGLGVELPSPRRRRHFPARPEALSLKPKPWAYTPGAAAAAATPGAPPWGPGRKPRAASPKPAQSSSCGSSEGSTSTPSALLCSSRSSSNSSSPSSTASSGFHSWSTGRCNAK